MGITQHSQVTSKVCSVCKEEKNLSEYYKKPGGKFGLNARCKPCHTEATMTWAKENTEATMAIRKRYNSVHKEKIADSWSEYYDKNKKKISEKKHIYRASNVEKRAEYQKNWNKQNPEKGVEYAHRRRLRQLDGDIRQFTNKDWEYLLRMFRNSCAYCGSKGKLTKDHVVPVSRGGRHSVGNIVPACGPCNFSKHDRLIIEWRTAHGTI
jgi:5-methylcytosine-specific restriction endonuclease McrA